MVGSTNVQAELALALQPLRSENVQLRRLVAVTQLKDRQTFTFCTTNLILQENIIFLMDWLLSKRCRAELLGTGCGTGLTSGLENFK